MTKGLTIYKRLRNEVHREFSTLTRFAASLDTSIPHLMDIVVRWGDTGHMPERPRDQAIIIAVQKKLRAARRYEQSNTNAELHTTAHQADL